MAICAGHALQHGFIVRTPGRSKKLRVCTVPDRIFHTRSVVGLSSLVDKGATRSVVSKFDIIVILLTACTM